MQYHLYCGSLLVLSLIGSAMSMQASIPSAEETWQIFQQQPMIEELKAGGGMPMKPSILLQHYRSKGLLPDGVIPDLHSGRFSDDWGVYIIDTDAKLFLLPAINGAWMWLQRL